MPKITLAPLPEWKVILKSIFTKTLNNKDLAKPWLLSDSDVPHWFSRSAIIMLAIAKWWKAYTNKESPTIWLPDYFCNQSLQFLRESNLSLHFYPVTEKLTPDWASCLLQASTHKPDIFILVHYFGSPSNGKQARQFCNEHECILVEDAAHILIPQQDIGSHGEFVFYSPHKLLAIPDGAVLIQRPKTKVLRRLSDKNSVEVMKQILVTMPQQSPPTFFWILKRILQKFLPDFLWLKRNKKESPVLMQYKPLQSDLSRSLLTTQIPYINDYALMRQTNQAIIKACYNTLEVKPMLPIGDYIPYITGFQCENNDNAEEYFSLFKKKRLPVMKWPDLPPEVLTESENHPVAVKLEKTLLFFPIHQSLGMASVKYIANSLGNQFRKTLVENGYELEWYKGGKEEWVDWIAKVENPNLMQSWEYGAVKMTNENWKIKRGLIKHNGQIVAIFQALQKSWGFLSVIRINRGPLIFNGFDDFETKYNIYKILRKTCRWWKGRILFIAPELVKMPENLGILELVHFRKRIAISWHSSLIDLSMAEIDIRKNLNGKWRNQLKKAEKSSIEFKDDKSDSSFFWLLDSYEQMMKDKSYKGPSVDLYKGYYAIDNNNHFVFQAWLDGEAVAGILILRHGTSCTYQIGWNNPNGRKVYANNLLLWNAVLEMKKCGCLWFDMGGIDKENTPEIANYKYGLEGQEYTMVGEWISF
ncbi:MAG: GNAT family N-acetyltransferase [Fidelibacterota bacterium]